MPLLTPTRALAVAYRVCCVRCVRVAKRKGAKSYNFSKDSSSKYSYYII